MNMNNQKLVETGKPKILTLDEKHGKIQYIINNERELHIVCVNILIRRYTEGIYTVRDVPENDTGFESYEHMLNTIPEHASQIRHAAEIWWKTYERAVEWYNKECAFITNVKNAINYVFDENDKYWWRNQAYFILDQRHAYEYEEVSLDSPTPIPTIIPKFDPLPHMKGVSFGYIVNDGNYIGTPGECLKCGSLVADYLCNATLIQYRPYAEDHDYWLACTNIECEHHYGEGYLQEYPIWFKRNEDAKHQ